MVNFFFLHLQTYKNKIILLTCADQHNIVLLGLFR